MPSEWEKGTIIPPGYVQRPVMIPLYRARGLMQPVLPLKIRKIIHDALSDVLGMPKPCA